MLIGLVNVALWLGRKYWGVTDEPVPRGRGRRRRRGRLRPRSLIAKELLDDADAWSACISGALEERDFLARLSRAGFADASIEVTNVYDGSAENNMCGAPPLPAGVQLASGFVRAVKPSGGCCSPGCCC